MSKASSVQRRHTASVALVLGVLVPVAYVLQKILWHQEYFSAGGAASSVCVLVAVGLVFQFPELIKATTDEDAKASTMRLLSLAIVFSFCAIMLRTGWNTGYLPSLNDQGNWVWLVTAAIGGKATQAYLEMNAARATAVANQPATTVPSTAVVPTPVKQGDAPKPLPAGNTQPTNGSPTNGTPLSSNKSAAEDGADI